MTAWMETIHAEHYHRSEVPYHEVAISWLKDYYERRFPPEDGRKIPLVIDVACGTGQLAGRVAPCCDRVIGFDISPAMLEVAKRVRARPNIDYRIGSALELDKVCPNEQADIIMVGMAINYFNTEAFYSKVRDHLKPGGVFAIFGYKTPGLGIKGLETILSQFFKEQIIEEPYCTALESLKRSYDNVKVPFDGEEHRMYRIHVSTNRDQLMALLLSNERTLKDGARGVHEFLEELSNGERLNVFCDIFGVLTFK